MKKDNPLLPIIHDCLFEELYEEYDVHFKYGVFIDNRIFSPVFGVLGIWEESFKDVYVFSTSERG